MEGMFFRRVQPHETTFEERMEGLRGAGFGVDAISAGEVRISRNGCAAIVKDIEGGKPDPGTPGILVGSDIARLVDGGFQKFLLTPDGHQHAAAAIHLKMLHKFSEDLREGLGLTSLYNEALGTVCDSHMYDRVKDRDAGAAKRPWER